MDDQARITGGSTGSPGAEGEGRTKRSGEWIAVALMVLALAFLLTIPFWARPRMGSGSYKYARRWKAQLLACQSLDDVKQQFNCFEITSGGTMVDVTAVEPGRPHALIASFPDGKWVACAYADSHWGSRAGGGTVVSRDSDGVVRVFFGHVCGDPRGYGKTLEEFYANLIRNSGMRALRERK